MRKRNTIRFHGSVEFKKENQQAKGVKRERLTEKQTLNHRDKLMVVGGAEAGWGGRCALRTSTGCCRKC